MSLRVLKIKSKINYKKVWCIKKNARWVSNNTIIDSLIKELMFQSQYFIIVYECLHILHGVSADSNAETTKITSQVEESSVPSFQPHASVDVSTTTAESPFIPQTLSSKFPYECGEGPTLCIAVVGATGELARGKIFPALFALYYSGFLPEVGVR